MTGSAEAGRLGLVLSGGGARGAYEAGVLAHLFAHVYPRLGDRFEFDVISGTSVGAVHAAYTAASTSLPDRQRALRLLDTWRRMRLRDVLQLSLSDVVGIPLRALGLTTMRRPGRAQADVLGGLVNITPLERVVEERIPWDALRRNLDAGVPGALCVSCTEIRSGRATVFMDGELADPSAWEYDPNARALRVAIDPRHVRASAAIPFLFPAVRIGERYYVDGGLRMNTPLAPALRLRCHRILIVALRHPPPATDDRPPYPEEVITQPAFLLGKVLDAFMLDQLEYEIQRIGLVNALIDHGMHVYGRDFLDKINVAVRNHRGVDYAPVRTLTIRPSRDLGRMAAECYRRQEKRGELGRLPSLLARFALRGVPEEEADLLSYLFFDRSFTQALMELGRKDARAHEDEILDLLRG